MLRLTLMEEATVLGSPIEAPDDTAFVTTSKVPARESTPMSSVR
jgi:hypothetical protein